MFSQSILSTLTEDLLIRIFERITSGSDSKACRLVCKDFYKLDSLSRRVIRVLRVEFLPGLLRNYPNVTELDLSVCPRIDDGTISTLLNRVRSFEWTRGLRKLNLSRSTGLRSMGLDMLARVCPLLEIVDVSHCYWFGDREAAAISKLTELRELKMDKCLNVSDVGLAKIAVRCGKLEKLSLKWCMEISDLCVDLLCKKCPELRFLDVSYLKITNDSLCSIASLPKLESLVMVGCPLVDDAGMEFLETGCPLLQGLDVSRCECISSSGLISVIRGHDGLVKLNASYCFVELSTNLLHWLKKLKNLKTIVIDGAHISDSGFTTLSTSCNEMMEIGMSKCVGMTNIDIVKFVSACFNLRILNLSCCPSVTDATISSTANSCKNLLVLKLESCTMITEKSLYQLGLSCTKLEELDLTDCSGVNDRGLEHLSRCSQLVCLKLGLCPSMSDKGLFHIGSNCTKLCELDLYRCMGIGDDSIAALSSGCKKLKKLNLSYCELGDKAMEYIGRLAELSDLEMRGLKITGVGLTSVAMGCKKLAYLDLKHCNKVNDLGFWALAYYSQNLRQVNVSCCALSDMALCMIMGNLSRLQDVDLLHLNNVTVEGYELALRACCVRIKKIKLLAPLRFLLSSELLDNLHSRGCKIRWD